MPEVFPGKVLLSGGQLWGKGGKQLWPQPLWPEEAVLVPPQGARAERMVASET